MGKKIVIITSPFGCIPPHAIGAVEKLWFQIGGVWKNQTHKVTYIAKKPVAQVVDENIYLKGYDRTGSLVKDLLLDFIYSLKALFKSPKADYAVLNTFWTPLLLPFFNWKYKRTIYNVARFPKNQMGFYQAVDILACVSSPVCKAVIEQSPSVANKVVVVPNPIDKEIYNTLTPMTLSDKTKIVYMGRVNREKGIELLVKAVDIIRKVHDVSLTIIGPTSIDLGGSGESYVKELNSYCSDWGIDWVSPIYDPIQLANIMSSGQIFCYPSLAEKGETFGVSPLEAMGLGMVPVVSDLDCFKDFIQDGVNGFVFNHRQENAHVELANILIHIITSKEKFKDISANAIATSCKYDVATIAEQYMKLLQVECS